MTQTIDTRRQERKETIKRLGVPADLELVAIFVDHGDEDYPGSREYTRSYTVEQVLAELQEDYKHGDLNDIESIEDLASQFRDMTWGGCVSLATVEEHEKRAKEERRAELEAAAAQLAQKHNVRVDSFEFIRALEEEIEKVRHEREEWNNPERRMEEWAACQYTGVGSEVYFDDLNFENGRYGARSDHLFAIREWLESNCPLLMAAYREDQLKKAQEKADE